MPECRARADAKVVVFSIHISMYISAIQAPSCCVSKLFGSTFLLKDKEIDLYSSLHKIVIHDKPHLVLPPLLLVLRPTALEMQRFLDEWKLFSFAVCRSNSEETTVVAFVHCRPALWQEMSVWAVKVGIKLKI